MAEVIKNKYGEELRRDALSSMEEFVASHPHVDQDQGLSREDVLAQRNLFGSNRLTPPVNCPSWVCCLLPCLGRLDSMVKFRQAAPEEAIVLRNNGRKLCLESHSLVCGDIIFLTSGAIVPADVRFLSKSDDFLLDGSNLSLHSQTRSVTVEPPQPLLHNNVLLSDNLAFMTDLVVQGDAIAVVLTTGNQTLFGRLIKSKHWPSCANSKNIERIPLVV